MLDMLIASLAALDPLWLSMLFPLVGIFGFNFSDQDSKQKSNSGFLEGADKTLASNVGAAGSVDLFDRAKIQLNRPVPQFNMSTSIPGLFREQEGAANAFANKMFANASAGGALRGQFSPNNTPGIVGSAITNMGATLLPMINQNLQTAALIPEQIRAQRFQNALSPLQALIAGLGSSASGTSSGLGFGFNIGGGGAAGGKG